MALRKTLSKLSKGSLMDFSFTLVKINRFGTYILPFNSLRLEMTKLLYFYAIFHSVNYTKPVCDYFTIDISIWPVIYLNLAGNYRSPAFISIPAVPGLTFKCKTHTID